MGIIILIILGVIFGPPLVLLLIGINIRKENPKTTKILFIIAVAYVLIGGGICATLLN